MKERASHIMHRINHDGQLQYWAHFYWSDCHQQDHKINDGSRKYLSYEDTWAELTFEISKEIR